MFKYLHFILPLCFSDL